MLSAPAGTQEKARDAGASSTLVLALPWAMALAYAGFFAYLSWLRLYTFQPHALDMGNMEQAAWNTAHGHPFRFNNLRFHMALEASGTSTRLSFHVEPIWLLLAVPYLIQAGPLNLIVIQAIVVASGVFPAAWLARRHVRLGLAQVAFPAAYLLAPPLEAATLYEFHPVTLSAALLLWAFYFADGGRYGLFVLFGVLAISTKEEIGLIVAMMSLWIWWRHRDRTFGLTAAVLSAGWSLFCVLVIMRHFSNGHSSPYCARFNPYLINGHTADPASKVTSCVGVAKLWLRHPDQVLSILVITQKLGFLHRILMPAGYLSLLSPLTLAISLPGYAIILFSNDVHMYGGLAHYPAELVPIVIAAAIMGTAWLSDQSGKRLHIPPTAVTTIACIWLLVASLSNQRVNGFTPLYEGFALPQVTHHVQVGHRILDMIPPDAAVSAGDYLNPDLSDRPNIYLFPDVGEAQYAVVDVSRDNFPLPPAGEMAFIRDLMLKPRTWGIVHAEDGYIVLERRAFNPRLPTTLPPSFYTFMLPAAAPAIEHPLLVDFGPSLQLAGFEIQRAEQVNLRLPDVVLTLYWRVRQPLTAPITPVVYLTNSDGAIDTHATDHPALDWLPVTAWPIGRTIVMTTVPLSVYTNDNGMVDLDLAVYQPGSFDVLADWTHRYHPNVRWTPGHVPMEAVDRGTILKLTQISAHW